MSRFPGALPADLDDRYTLTRELGQGGMATVYLADDHRHQRQVAVKILHRELLEVIGPHRFHREIRIAAQLNHPNILPLLESGETEGLLWFVMPWVDGESLRARLDREGALPIPAALAMARQTAAALDHAHAQGVVHRDIKPENILLAGEHAWVSDFGVARVTHADDGSPITTASLIVGTPQYMSPEQGRGGSEGIDARSDVYGLACLVYEMLAGSPPFTGPTREVVLARHALDPVPPIRTARHTVSVAAQEVMQKALAKTAADRYASAGEFVGALERAMASRRRWSRRQLVGAGVLAGVLALALFLLWPSVPLEAHRIMILPLDTRGEVTISGEDVATIIESQLNASDTLLASYTTGGLAVPPASWSDSAVRRVAQTGRARWVLTGRIHTTDSIRASGQVHDHSLRRAVPWSVAAPLATDPYRLGAMVAGHLLPRLLQTGGAPVDQQVLSPDVRAVAAYLQGEREYRRGQYRTADSLFRLAVARDSAFAWAALRAAQAASWLTERSRAARLAAIALQRADSLPRRYAALARGLSAYQRGAADSALTHLREALALDSRWVEAWMAQGEVWLHLLPAAGAPLDSAARAFDLARSLDPGFTPPLFHQLQVAVWRVEPGRADSLLRLFQRGNPPEDEQVIATLMHACLHDPPATGAWQSALGEGAALGPVLQAAVWLSVGGLRHWACAREGLRAVMQADAPAGTSAFYARQTLASIEAARGSAEGVVEATRDEVYTGLRDVLLTMLASGDLPMGTLMDSTWPRLRALADGPQRTAHAVWAAGIGAIDRDSLALAVRLAARLDTLVSDPVEDPRTVRLLAGSLAGRLRLARGDTAGALALLGTLRPTADQGILRWVPWEALAWERLTVARLLAARGRHLDAMDVADGFDSPAGIGLIPWVPASLLLREELALALNDRARASALRARYQGLRDTPAPAPSQGR